MSRRLRVTTQMSRWRSRNRGWILVRQEKGGRGCLGEGAARADTLGLSRRRKDAKVLFHRLCVFAPWRPRLRGDDIPWRYAVRGLVDRCAARGLAHPTGGAEAFASVRSPLLLNCARSAPSPFSAPSAALR